MNRPSYSQVILTFLESNYIELTYASLESVACALELNGEPLSRSNPGILIGVSQKKTMDGASGVIRSERIVSNASPRGVLRQGDKPRFGKSIENSPERHQGMGMNLGKRPQTTTQNGINSMSTANSINTANGTIVNQGVLRQDVMHGNTENSQNQTWSGYFRSMFLSDD